MSGILTTSDNQKIHYDHYKNGHKEVIIIAHGFFNSKQSLLLQELANSFKDEYDVVLFDFRGHGESQGVFYWTSKEYQDVLAVLDYAKKYYEKIGVVGFSMGAATSIISASKSDIVDSLVAVSSPSEFGKIDFHFWDLDIENDLVYGLIGKGRKGKGVRPGPFWERKEKPIDLVKDFKVPVFYIHGDADWVVRPWHSKKLFENTKSVKDLAIIKKGLHAEYLIRRNKKEIVILIKNWFEKTLRNNNYYGQSQTS